MINIGVKTIEDNGQVLESNGVVSTVDFSSIHTDIPEDKIGLFKDIIGTVTEINDLSKAAKILDKATIENISQEFTKVLDIIAENGNSELIGDISSFAYNRIVCEGNMLASKLMKGIAADIKVNTGHDDGDTSIAAAKEVEETSEEE